MVSSINLNDIYTFHCVSELKSITAASKKLNISKQTISRKLAQLEEALGVTLVARNSRSFKLTDAGKEYNINCEKIIRQIENANALVQQHQVSAEGTIKICMSHELTNSKTCELVIDFLNQNPSIKLDISLCDKNAFSVSDGYDLGLQLGDLDDSSLVARSLGGVNYALVSSPQYLQEFGIPSDCNDSTHHTYISVTKSTYPMEKLLPLNKCRQLVVNEFVLAKQFAIQGFGLARLPLFMCADSLESKDLVILPSTQCMEVKPLNMVYRKDKLMPGYLRLFIDFVADICREKRPWILDMSPYLYTPTDTEPQKKLPELDTEMA